jgi:hypothetical protein
MTHSYETTPAYEISLICMRNDIHMGHDSSIRDMTHLYETWLIHVRHDLFAWDMTFIWDVTQSYETWLIHCAFLTLDMRWITSAGIHKHTQKRLQTRTTHIHTNTQTYTHTHTCTHMHTHIMWHTHTCTHTHTPVCIYTHAHTHTHAQESLSQTYTQSLTFVRVDQITRNHRRPAICHTKHQLSTFYANKSYILLQKSLWLSMRRPHIIPDDILSATPNVNCLLLLQQSPVIFCQQLYDLVQISHIIFCKRSLRFETMHNRRRPAVRHSKHKWLLLLCRRA